MFIFLKIRSFFWSIDPGYIYLKHAFKTVLAIIISLWLVKDAGFLPVLLAGIGSGFCMQGIPARTKFLRFFHILFFMLACFAAFCIGLLCRDAPNLLAVYLMLLGFAVNYARRFPLDWGAAPMMVWTLAFLATVLPFSSTNEAWANIHGLIIGFLVAGFVTAFVFPEKDQYLLVEQVNHLIETLSRGLNDSRRLILKKDIDFKHAIFTQAKSTIVQLFDAIQTLQNRYLINMQQTSITPIARALYSMCNSYQLLIEALCQLHQYQDDIPRSYKRMVSHTCKEFSQAIQTLSMDENYNMTTKSKLFSLQEKDLSNHFTIEPKIVMALLNLKLGFDLLNEQMIQLTRRENAT